MLLKNMKKEDEIEDLIVTLNFLKEEINEKLEEFKNLLKNEENIKKINDVAAFAKNTKEILKEVEELKTSVITLQKIIETQEEFAAQDIMNNFYRLKKIINDFKKELDEDLEQKIKELFEKQKEKTIENLEKNTIKTFRKLLEIFKEKEETIIRIKENVDKQLEEIETELELLKIYTKDIRMSKTQKIITISLFLCVVFLSFSNFSLYKKVKDNNKQIYNIEKALIVLNKNQKSILELLIKH